MHNKFTMKMQGLMKEAQKVDKTFSLKPLDKEDGVPPDTSPNAISLNHTDMQVFFKLGEKANFQTQKPWGHGNEDIPEDKYVNPIVPFSIVFGCNVRPYNIVGRFQQEWEKQGEKKIWLKTLDSHDPKGATVLYMMFTQEMEQTLIS